MENYDPRNPIIKATDDESDEVEGHRYVMNKPAGPGEETVQANDDGDESDKAEGHRSVMDKADGPNGSGR